MLDGVRRTLGRLVGREEAAAPAAPDHPLLFSDHEEIRDIARQLARTKLEMDRSVLGLRAWARDLSRRLAASPEAVAGALDLRALGETVGGVAHNFNNSLAAILAYTELLLKEVPGESAQRRLRVIRDVALEASAAVRRLQDFIAREPEAVVGPVALPALVGEAVEMTAPRWRDEAERRGIVITLATEVEAAPHVEGNAWELREMLVHLILGGVSALPHGGRIGIRARGEEPGWVALEVAHPGAPVERLAEVQAIVERHGGTLRIQPAGGEAVYRIRLRASRFHIIPPAEEAPAAPAAAEALRILLVDNDQRLLGVMSDMLRSGGHAVTTAASGEEALALFQPGQHDLVITDLGMPGMNGWEVAAEVKRRAPATPVFLLTGWGDTVAGEGSRHIDHVIAKPVSQDALLEQLASLRRPGRAPA